MHRSLPTCKSERGIRGHARMMTAQGRWDGLPRRGKEAKFRRIHGNAVKVEEESKCQWMSLMEVPLLVARALV